MIVITTMYNKIKNSGIIRKSNINCVCIHKGKINANCHLPIQTRTNYIAIADKFILSLLQRNRSSSTLDILMIKNCQELMRAISISAQSLYTISKNDWDYLQIFFKGTVS